MEMFVLQVFDVLEGQAHSALLLDAVILGILGQLGVKVTYVPLSCGIIALDRRKDMVKASMQRCIIVESTVTGICTGLMGLNQGMKPCVAEANMMAIAPDPDNIHHHGELVENDVAKCS
ncbi:hypothetical protein KIN20_034149 [Parelaphostrongylus tenuis]|uniref:Uncharacterized protein n=1 Tax=Parelaphostrongylus tenuis TaxID=148309 RepID=A0AAD5RBV8_PARTN|nr:hypothetical protein KIN20_034149 [Parelaphostrongylus tenuis]